MEDDEDTQSSASPPPVTVAARGSPPESPPHANGLKAGDGEGDSEEEQKLQHTPPQQPPVTVAANPKHAPVAVGIPIHKAKEAAAAAGGIGSSGGREDCWSEGATWALIGAWGERFRELTRGNLKQKDWQEVADIVSSRDNYTKPPKTDSQCKNRIDTLKKKYKIEKSKAATGSSSWAFFRRLDDLISNSPHSKTPTPPPPTATATATADDSKPPFPSGLGSFRHQLQMLQMKKKKRTTKKRSHRQLLQRPPSFLTPPAQRSPETSDSLPPETKANGKEKRTRFGGADPGLGMAAPALAGVRAGGGADEGLRELTRAITKFGEVYEKVESTKLQQSAEMERQRMELATELELQRMDFFIKTLLELTQLKLRNGRAAGGHGRSSTTAVADDDENHKDNTTSCKHHSNDDSGGHYQGSKELDLRSSH